MSQKNIIDLEQYAQELKLEVDKNNATNEKKFARDYNKCVEIMNRFDNEFLKTKESTKFAEKLLDQLLAKHHFSLKEVKDNKFPKCDKLEQAIKNYVLIGRIKKK